MKPNPDPKLRFLQQPIIQPLLTPEKPLWTLTIGILPDGRATINASKPTNLIEIGCVLSGIVTQNLHAIAHAGETQSVKPNREQPHSFDNEDKLKGCGLCGKRYLDPIHRMTLGTDIPIESGEAG